MDINDLKFGIENSFVPPFENGLRMTKTYEKAGFDSIWFADHIMNWPPKAIWSPDITSTASFMKSPHDIYNVYPTMAVVASKTKNMFIGTGVTETFRHHPALLAHMFITLDHISKGRMILGIGAGEKENTVPYGIKWEKPVTRLEEAIKIIKLLWKKDKKVEFNGEIWNLNDAVLSLKPYKRNKAPPIWIGAHGPKMLKLTGELGDGWLPVALNPKEYKSKLDTIHSIAKKEDRDPAKITPALFLYVIIDENKDECDKLLSSPLVKNLMLTCSDKNFKRYGSSHPFGDNYQGMLEYIPSKYDKETLMKAYEKVPQELVRDIFFSGTPDEIIKKIEDYARIGLKHAIILNFTNTCDITKAGSSYTCLKKVMDYFKDS
jgi:phthiodiolone/phenolphthiodiolone dimycocerosates ketoreductase